MKNKVLKNLVLFLTAVLAYATFQADILAVKAQVLPVSVSVDNLGFGFVFPGEELQKEFVVGIVSDGADWVEYEITQTPKPGYLDLCPFLRKENSEGEGDVEGSAFLDVEMDSSDIWQVALDVPAINSYVGQSHLFLVVDSGGDFGCNIGINVIDYGQGEEPPAPPEPGPTGPLADFFPTGGELLILNERATDIGKNTATILWDTQKSGAPALATSRVIFSSQDESHIFNPGSLPNYGYFSSTAEYTNLVSSHEVLLNGLLPETTYYYRCVSHNSDEAIGLEYSFTTLSDIELAGGQQEEEEQGGAVSGTTTEVGSPTEPGVSQEDQGPGAEGEEQEGQEQEGEGTEGEVAGEETEALEEEQGGEEQEPGEQGKGLPEFLAAIAEAFSGNICKLMFILIIILTVIFILLLEKERKEGEEADRTKLRIVGGVIVILLILYWLFCPRYWILLLTIFIMLLLWYIFRGRKEEKKPTGTLFNQDV